MPGKRRQSNPVDNNAQSTTDPQNSAVGRAVRVLGEIGRSDSSEPPSMSELARRTRLPKSTVHRLLGVLESLGAIERNVLGYQLSKEIPLVGSTAGDDTLRRVAMPYLIDLYLQVHEAVGLAVLRGDRVVYLETIFQHRHRGFMHTVGLSGPAHATATGKLLLAYRPSIAARYGTELPMPAFTQRTITSPARFMAELAQIRTEGIAFSLEEQQRGMVGAAVPVTDPQGEPVAAIAVGGPRCHLDVTAAAAQLRLTAGIVSAALSARNFRVARAARSYVLVKDRPAQLTHRNG